MAYPQFRRRTIWLIDLALVAWIAAWVAFGLWTSREVQKLTGLSETVSTAGDALVQVGQTLDQYRRVPLLGRFLGNLTPAIQRIETAGRTAQTNGRTSQVTIHNLSRQLEILVIALPTAVILIFYLPWRLARAGEVHTVRRALRRGAPGMEKALAYRATQTLTLGRLLRISNDPWLDLGSGRVELLAKAEAERLGLRRAAKRAWAGDARGAGRPGGPDPDSS